MTNDAALPGGEFDGDQSPRSMTRRGVLQTLAALGVGSAVFQRALAAAAENGAVTAEMIQRAEWVAGLQLSESDRDATAAAVNRLQNKLAVLRSLPLDYSVPPALNFYPAGVQPVAASEADNRVVPLESAAGQKPADEDNLAFLPLTELAALLRTRQVTSVELTELYLARLKRFDPLLKFVVTLTTDVAMEQARRADREIAAGRYRGPLHGVPWGAKDLIAYPGYPTTWGATPFKDQKIEETATVARRLNDAGAVLVAKLTLGALALGDQWFGGMTRNPWNPNEGSSGSSAGSASAVAAGCVGFAIGSETLGSIVSPCRRCGTTGLRPTFGRVSRFGCMSLAWSMDKLGPIARSIEDCALVFGAIHGADGLDPTALDRPFHWPLREDLRNLRVGFIEQEGVVADRRELQVLRDLGVQLVPIKLPAFPPAGPLTVILNTEAAAAFDSLTRAGVTEGIEQWTSSFAQGQFTPAVEYLRANRLRTLLIREMERAIENVDLYIGGDDLTITNLTGHPTVVLPFATEQRGEVEVPGSVTLTGHHFGETRLLAVAHALQSATDFHLARPPLARFLAN